MQKQSITAPDIGTILDNLPDGVTTISLDCFDTLLWRNVHEPRDIFAELDFPGSIFTRAYAESRARNAKMSNENSVEVTLDDIYQCMLPRATREERAAAISAELVAEARHCYGFQPFCTLLAESKSRGLRTMIVSDIYMSADELETLIGKAAGQDVLETIDHIYTSCDNGSGKTGTLFVHIMQKLGLKPAEILHMGDNAMADFHAPQKLGINALHFQQFTHALETRLRMEASAAKMVDRTTHDTSPVFQPYRAAMAYRHTPFGNDNENFGHDVLGPVYTGFAKWVAEEAKEHQQKTGITPKLLFLLRDGHLPKMVFDALYPDMAENSHAIELSRFTAIASSFTDKEAIERYLALFLKEGVFWAMVKQMLFTKKESDKLLKARNRQEFVRKITSPANSRKIMKRSAEFAANLQTYLGNFGIEKGDHVMFVDLGYNGTVQNFVHDRLAQDMKLTILGRYLVMNENINAGLDKKGLLDDRHYDKHALSLFTSHISLLEQYSTMSQGSVVGYKDNGTPIRKANDMKGEQSEARELAQEKCVAYAQHHDKYWHKAPQSADMHCWRHVAAAVLARALHLPDTSEITMLADVQHDVNLGTDQQVKMVDIERGREEFRRRGAFYVKNNNRMFRSGELQQQGLLPNLGMMSLSRHGINLKKPILNRPDFLCRSYI